MNYLMVRKTNTKTLYGDRAFSVAGLSLWNTSPLQTRKSGNVHSFKKALRRSFPCRRIICRIFIFLILQACNFIFLIVFNFIINYNSFINLVI